MFLSHSISNLCYEPPQSYTFTYWGPVFFKDQLGDHKFPTLTLHCKPLEGRTLVGQCAQHLEGVQHAFEGK